MGGVINGFISGASRGMAQAGQMLLASKLDKEREEAAFLRRSALEKSTQASRQEFMGGENEKNRMAQSDLAEQSDYATSQRDDKKYAAEAAEGKLNRASDLSVANAKESGSNATNQLKNIRGIMENSNKTFLEAVAIVFPGAKVDYTTVDGERMVAVVAEDGYTELGRFTENDVGKGVFVNKGEKPERTPGVFTRDEIKAKQAELSKKNTFFDATTKEAEEALKIEQESGSTGGMINRVRAQDTPKPSAPKKDYSNMLGIKPAGAAAPKPGSVESAMTPGKAPVDINRDTPDIKMPAPKKVELGKGGRSPMQVKGDNDLEKQIMSVKSSKSGSDKNRMRIYENRAADRVREALKDGARVTSRAILEAALKSRDMTAEEDKQIKAILNK